MVLLPWEFEKRANISAAEKFGNDGTPDARADQLNDRITPLVLTEETPMAEPPEDDMDARDAAAHRKKTAVWSLKQRKAKASGRESSPGRDQQFDRRAPFDPVDLERRLLRDQEAPGIVWTMGEDSLGQCGHAAARPEETPYPAPLEAKRLKGGVRSVHAGSVCTIVINEVGEALGFGSGPFRAAVAEEERPEADLSLTYAGAPPYRVLSADPQGAASSGGPQMGRVEEAARATHGAAIDAVLGTEKGERLAANRFSSTHQVVDNAIGRRRQELGVPTLLSALLMPIQQIECGDDFVIALMQNGIVFSWGDGEEGKLGLGKPQSHVKPTMLDFLLPSSYAEMAKKSKDKDALLKTGAKVIRKRDKDFQIVSIACGARHTLALSSANDAFSWGAGGAGQLGHGSFADELLPHPVQAFKAKGTRVLSIVAGSYHSAAVTTSTRTEVATHLYTWGLGEHGRLGHGDTVRCSAPVEMLYHRVKPRKKHVAERDPPPSRRTHGLDWMSFETGHVLEWSQVACGGRHCAALSKTGHVFTWGSDDAGQLGHGGKMVTQRLACLLWLHRTDSRGKPGPVVQDVRLVGCGHRYTAALTWRGEVFVWGQLGSASWRVPKVLVALQRAVVVQLACGQAHLVVVTGDGETLYDDLLQKEQARNNPSMLPSCPLRPSAPPPLRPSAPPPLNPSTRLPTCKRVCVCVRAPQERGMAAKVQLEKIEQKRAKMKEEARIAQQEAMASKHARRDEKKRVKTLKKQDQKVRTAACASNRLRQPLKQLGCRGGWRLTRTPRPDRVLRSVRSSRGSGGARRRSTAMRTRTGRTEP